MRHERRIRVNVDQLDDVLVSNNSSAAAFGNLLRGMDNPVIVRVVEGISSDLLTCRQSSFE